MADVIALFYMWSMLQPPGRCYSLLLYKLEDVIAINFCFVADVIDITDCVADVFAI